MINWSSGWWDIWIACRMLCFGVKAFVGNHTKVAISMLVFWLAPWPLGFQISYDIFVPSTICVKLLDMLHKLCGELSYPDHQAWLQSRQNMLSLWSQWLEDIVWLWCTIHICNRRTPDHSDILFENRKHSGSPQNDTAKHTITSKCNCTDTSSYW